MQIRIVSSLFLGIILYSFSSSAMTINGLKIKELIKPEEIVVYNKEPQANNIVVRIQGRNIKCRCIRTNKRCRARARKSIL